MTYFNAQSTPEEPGMWDTLRELVAWLDRSNGNGEHETAMRLLKVTEEAGEAAQAYITSRGQNPRKPRTGSDHEVADELVDVIVTAFTALHSFAPNPQAHFEAKLRNIRQRVLDLE
ncbi:MazG-like family protein [Streptacidiphilus carbonis]|uniref:MazG-like family protein n=1 Tax=Streptacidiphilus carbonis TaxID=105422 RepID=UPI0005A9BFEE|nr:MazG-like family protein [Streptacidiphilus carbonis]